MPRCVAKVHEEPAAEELEGALALFAGLVMNKELVKQIVGWGMNILKESPFYQELTALAREEGREEGLTPYYATGEYLRAKHALIRNQSGRTIETWALQLLPIDPTARILDAGCGWGRFSWPLIETYQLPSTNLVCADVSLGMVQSAVQEAEKRGHHPHFVTCGIEALPFPAQHFDGAMANYVLYDVKPMAQGVRELARILKPDGWLLAAAHGIVQVPVIELHYQALDRLGICYEQEAPSPFNLDNGAAILGNSFGQIERHEFVDEEIYPDAAAFTQTYLTIGRYRALLARADVSEHDKTALPHVFHELANAIAHQHGAIRVPVLMGAFVCTKPR